MHARRRWPCAPRVLHNAEIVRRLGRLSRDYGLLFGAIRLFTRSRQAPSAGCYVCYLRRMFQRRTLSCLLPLVACLAACSSTPTSSPLTKSEATAQFGAAYCQRLSTCFPDTFNSMFPTGVQQCVDKLQSDVQDPSAADACSQAQIDTCVSDVAKSVCATSYAASVPPASCHGC